MNNTNINLSLDYNNFHEADVQAITFYDLYVDFSNAGPHLNILFSKFQEIKEAFEDCGNNGLNKLLMNSLEKISLLKSATLKLECNTNGSDIIDKEPNTNIILSKDDLTILQQKDDIIISMQDKIDQFDLQKQEMAKQIDCLNNDLEQQIDECIEFNSNEATYKSEINNLLNELAVPNKYDNMTVLDMLATLRGVILDKKNDHIAYLTVHNDTLNLCDQQANCANEQSFKERSESQLNNTLVFETLEQEFEHELKMTEELSNLKTRLDIMISENNALNLKNEEAQKISEDTINNLKLNIVNLKSDFEKQIASLTNENKEFVMKIEDMNRTNENNDNMIACLKLEISNLTVELESALKNIALIQVKDSTVYVSGRNKEDSNKSCQISSEMLDDSSRRLEEELVASNTLLESIREAHSLLEEEKNHLLAGNQEMELRISKLLLEKERLESELETLQSNLKNSKDEKIALTIKLSTAELGNAEVVERLQIKIDELQSVLEANSLDLDSAIENFIKVSEELETKNASLKEKEDCYVDTCSRLESIGKDLENEREEKCRIEAEMESTAIEQRNQLLELRGMLAILESENRGYRKSNAAKEAAEQKLIDLQIQVGEVELELMSEQEKNRLLTTQVEELEVTRDLVKVTVESLTNENRRMEDENKFNEKKINGLATEIEELQNRMQHDLDGVAKELLEMSNRNVDQEKTIGEQSLTINELKNKIECNDTKIGHLEIELDLKVEDLKICWKSMAEKDTSLRDLESELDKAKVAVTAITEKEEQLKKAEHYAKELKSELSSMNKEMQSCKREVQLREKLLADMEQAAATMKDSHEKLQQCEDKLKSKDFDYRSLTNRFREKENEIEQLKKKAKEAFQTQQTLRGQLKDMTNKLDGYKERCEYVEGGGRDSRSHLMSEVASLTSELEERSAQFNNLQMKLKEFDRQSGSVLAEKNVDVTEEQRQAEAALREARIIELKEELQEVTDHYVELKGQYVDKRKRTAELEAKYAKLLKFCEENHYVYPK